MTTVVLCGSARYEAQFKEASKRLGLMGIVVIGLSSYPSENEGDKNWYRADEKEMLDLVHFEKIRIADAVLVIDGIPTFDGESSSDPYVGFSTAREILWARMQNRPMISLLSSSGWGNIRELLDNLYDQEMLREHAWLPGHAAHVLNVRSGTDVVNNLIHEDVQNILHAGMSVLACNGNEASTAFATKTLEIAGLDPITDMPALMPMFQDPPASTDVVSATSTEVMTLKMSVLELWLDVVYTSRQLLEKGGNRVAVRDRLARLHDKMVNAGIPTDKLAV